MTDVFFYTVYRSTKVLLSLHDYYQSYKTNISCNISTTKIYVVIVVEDLIKKGLSLKFY